MERARKARILFWGITIVLVGSLLRPITAYAWGDSDGGRPSYTLEEIKSNVLGDKIVFNSISNGTIGDEKNFVGAREYNGPNISGTANVWNGNEITVKDGQEYIIRLYVHNNTLQEDNVAKDVKVAFSIPPVSARRLQVNGFIESSNASPQRYWDYVDFVGDTPFHLEYIYDSALLENSGIGAGGFRLSDEIVTNASGGGTQIGYYDHGDGTLDGIIPAGNNESFITIRVKAVFDTSFDVETKVRLVNDEDDGWKDSVEVSVGDTVEFQISYMNMSDAVQTDVAVRNLLPDNLHYVDGSARVVNAKHSDGISIEGDYLNTDGIVIGSYNTGTGATITFSAKVADDNLTVGENTLENLGQIMADSHTMQASTTVIVLKKERLRYALYWAGGMICLSAATVIFIRIWRHKKL